MRLIFGFALFLTVGLLAGCATLSKPQCQTGDWYNVGQNDGRSGYTMARLDEHREACSKHGVVIDQATYTAGRELGLKSYCTIDNAATVGLAGRSYSGVCEGEIGLSFARVHRVASDVNYVDGRISALQSDIKSKTEKLADVATPKAEKDRLVEDIRDLNVELSSQFARQAEKQATLRQVMLEEQNRLSKL